MSDDVLMYSPRVGQALSFVADAFATKTRKVGGAPYLGHLLGVCRLVMDNGGSESQIIAALLHDYYEDIWAGESNGSLQKLFGRSVEELVLCLTESKKGAWKERKMAYIDRLRSAAPEVKLIAAADKIDNLIDLTHQLDALGDAKVWPSFNGKPHDVFWYYQMCADVLRTEWKSPLLDQLDALVASLGMHLASETIKMEKR